MSHSTTKAVKVAILANGTITILKSIVGFLSHSPSMVNEAIHSFMDTLNQVFLLIGLKQGNKGADKEYAYGYKQRKYIWNLYSAIGLFSIGAGLGLFHAIESWLKFSKGSATFELSQTMFYTSITVLLGAIFAEGYSFYVATKQFLVRMKEDGYKNPLQYVLKCKDPTLVAIVLEDSAAMFGLVLAIIGITLAYITGNPIFDVVFSGIIALLLGFIAFFLCKVNVEYLTNKRDADIEAYFHELVSSNDLLLHCKDVRSIILDETLTIVMADVLLDTNDISSYLVQEHADNEEMDAQSVTEVVEGMIALKHKILSELESKIQERFPRASQITVEFHSK